MQLTKEYLSAKNRQYYCQHKDEILKKNRALAHRRSRLAARLKKEQEMYEKRKKQFLEKGT